MWTHRHVGVYLHVVRSRIGRTTEAAGNKNTSNSKRRDSFKNLTTKVNRHEEPFIWEKSLRGGQESHQGHPSNEKGVPRSTIFSMQYSFEILDSNENCGRRSTRLWHTSIISHAVAGTRLESKMRYIPKETGICFLNNLDSLLLPLHRDILWISEISYR